MNKTANKVMFYGGPWDGRLVEIPDYLQEYYVPQKMPSRIEIYEPSRGVQVLSAKYVRRLTLWGNTAFWFIPDKETQD